MLKALLATTLFLFTTATAYELQDENEEVARTCRITVKIQVIRDEQMQKTTGRALVIATLTDDEGNPIRQNRVNFSANAGTFTCSLPEDTSTTENCYTTGFDGIAKMYLTNIPVNTPIRATASYNCDDRTVSSFATMSISRSIVKKKKVVHPR